MKIAFLIILGLCAVTLAQDADQPERPYVITSEVVVFRVPVGELKSLGIEAEKAAHPLALFRTLLLRVEDKKALIIGQARLTSPAGVKASSGGGEELIYPRAYQSLQEQGDGRGYPAENVIAKMGIAYTARPQALSKKEVQVALEFACDIAKPDPVDYDKALANLKAGPPVMQIPQPTFLRHHVKEAVTMPSGGVALLGVRSLPKSFDKENAYRDLILLRALVHH